MSSTTVVAISRQFGSGGARIGYAVAQRLGFRYADREILAEAAKRFEVDSDEIASMEERVRTLWERFAETLSRGSVDAPYTPPPLPIVSPLELFKEERRIIHALADAGHAVLVGRGAAHILGGRPDVLRVFLHAPFENRVTVAIDEYKLPDRDAAAALVRQSDAQRSRFVHAVTGHEWCDATLYDLTLNTTVTGVGRAADLIVQMVQHQAAATDTKR